VLLDLRPRRGLAPLLSSNAPNAGLALGVLLTAVLVQYGRAPTQLVWWLLFGVFAAALVLVAVMAETGTRRPGALASFLLTGVGAATAFAARDLRATAQMLGGCLALAVGAGVTIAAIQTGTAAVLLLGTGIAGIGYGTAFLGAYRTVVALASPSDRAGLIAAIFSISYLAMACRPWLPASPLPISACTAPRWRTRRRSPGSPQPPPAPSSLGAAPAPVHRGTPGRPLPMYVRSRAPCRRTCRPRIRKQS
jgi:hypothetical protein